MARGDVGGGVTRIVPALVALLVLAGSACGDGTEPAPSAGPSTDPPRTVADALAAHGLDACDALPRLEAPADQYRDDPVYVGNEMPVDRVEAWARTRPGYQDVWIDREHRGWITVAFTGDVEARRVELREELPDVGAVAVEARTTVAERQRTREEVGQVLGTLEVEGASGDDITKGVVMFHLGVLRTEVLDALEPFAGAPVCFDGTLPEDAVEDGPQPRSGDGWRLLLDQEPALPYRTGVATTEEQYERLWADAELRGDRPPVDFSREVVVWFGAVFGSSCPIRMDDVVVDDEARLVHAAIVVPGNPDACTDDANGRAFVVALERARLPEGPFAVQLGPDDPPSGVPEERTLVDADLRAAGSAARDDQIGPDPELLAAAEEGGG
jgi:hypothetical protein